MAGIVSIVWRALQRLGLEASASLALADANKAFARQNYLRARLLWKPLAERGNANAQYGLGLLSERGLGIPKDEGEAADWYVKAASQGFAQAQHNLGCMYATGRGVPRADSEAVLWSRQSADQGHAAAQHALGSLYEAGQGVAQNYEEAARLYRKAADKGCADAQFGLARLYAQGQGVPLDYSKARKLFALAASGFGKIEDEELRRAAIKLRDQAASLMSAAD